MAAGVNILHKRKGSAFSGGDLATGEIGIDTVNDTLSFSKDGSTITIIDPSAGGGNVSNTGTPTNQQVAIFTDATTIQGVNGLQWTGTTLECTNISAVGGAITGGKITAGSATGGGDVATMGYSGTQGLQLRGAGSTYDYIVQGQGGTIFTVASSTQNVLFSGEITATNAQLTTPTITLSQSTTPTPTAEGQIEWDTDDNTIKIGDGSGTKTFSSDSDLSITESQISDLGTYGDASGPASATDNAIARFDGAGGKTLQNSSVTINDNGSIATAQGIVFTERANHVETPAAGDGELWVRNDTSPANSLNFTDDDGQDWHLQLGGHLAWKYDTSTTDGDPTFGLFRADNAAPSSTTELYFDDSPLSGGNGLPEYLWERLEIGTILMLYNHQSDNHIEFVVNGASVDETGYWRIQVDAINSVADYDTDGTYSVVILPTSGAIGEVIWFADDTVPENFLECDGSEISQTTYALLYGVIGTWWDNSPAGGNFNIPDLRGEFIRGWDNGKGTDSGRVFASSQASANESHSHTVTDRYDTTSTNSAASGSGHNLRKAAITNNTRTTSTSGSEARPRNYALMPCIRYR